MLQIEPGQLYFLGREASDRLQALADLGLGESEKAFSLALKTIQFHVDAMTRLMAQTRHVHDLEGARRLWSELFEVMRDGVGCIGSTRKQAVESALKCTEMFYASAFERRAAAAAVDGD